MRVLFIAHSYPRTPGDAAGSFLLHLAVALQRHDVQVRVVAPSAPGYPAVDTFDGIRVDRFRYAPARHETLAYTGTMAAAVQQSVSAKLALCGLLAAGAACTRRASREFRPQVVHAHWWFPAGLIARLAAPISGPPRVVTMHGSDVRLATTNAYGAPLFRFVMRGVRSATTVSRWLADSAQAMSPGLTVEVAPMPAATSLFSPLAIEQPRSARLLFVGRLNAQKGVRDLLAAFAAMRSPVLLDIVGDGPDAAPLRQVAVALGVDARITWHGAVPQTALAPLYRSAGAVVVPSVGEGLGLVAIEAGLCETPTIAYASGGLIDVVRDQVTGLLVPPGDTTALAAAMDTLVADPVRRQTYGIASRAFALAHFTPDAVAARYAQIYRRVAAQ